MKVILKSKATLFAFGIAGLLLASIASASAGVVRDHRDAPVVRDHRDNAPVVRDHRAEPPRQASKGGGVTVTSHPRPPKCLGNLCGKKICVGPFCT